MPSRAQNNSKSYDTFLKIWKNTLDNRVSIKRKHLKSNNSPFINKDISKPIMIQIR